MVIIALRCRCPSRCPGLANLATLLVFRSSISTVFFHTYTPRPRRQHHPTSPRSIQSTAVRGPQHSNIHTITDQSSTRPSRSAIDNWPDVFIHSSQPLASPVDPPRTCNGRPLARSRSLASCVCAPEGAEPRVQASDRRRREEDLHLTCARPDRTPLRSSSTSPFRHSACRGASIPGLAGFKGHSTTMEVVERRGSLARAFDRVRAAMKRKRNASSPQVATSVETRMDEGVDIVMRPAPVVESEQQQATMLPSIPNAAPNTAISATMDPRVEVDPGNESEEALLPIPTSRADIRNHHIQELFSRHAHGSQFGARYMGPTPERPSKIRRVEKPIRIRIHWTCHECNTKFGREQICVECGHPRCNECPRQPAKQVRALVETTRLRMHEQDRERQALSSEDEVNSPVSTASSPAILSTPIQFSSQPLDLDPNLSEDTSDSPFDFAFYGRPRTTALRASYRSARLQHTTMLNMCHECGAPLSSDSDACPNCSHARCERCPRPAVATTTSSPATQWFATRRAIGDRSLSADELPMVKAVRRVYRKPRQRVRYICEHCETMFIEGDNCRECGHERCGDCRREPYVES